MLRFFRTIRHTFINEGKTFQYLKYAIGEIILVVIGILIALQINNWNENKRNVFEHQFHLTKLISSLSTDTKLLKEKIQINETVIEALHFCIEALQTKSTINKAEFFKRYKFVSIILNFSQNKSSFETMISTGKISLIKDQNLINKLFSYYNSKEFTKSDERHSNYTNNILSPYVFSYDAIPNLDESSYDKFDLSKYNSPVKSMEDYKTNVFILNGIRVKLLFVEGQKQNYTKLLVDAKVLISMISDELEQ